MQYGFFDYKYNIEGYAGQDFDNEMRYVYMIFCLVAVPLLAFLLRKVRHEKITVTLRALAVFIFALEVVKLVWESYYDVTTGRGFNYGGILPFDTCSMFTFLLPLAAFSRGRVRESALAWLATIGLAGGLSNILFLQALKWYPFWTFGAMFSMIFHFSMAFVALWIVTSGYLRFRPGHILYAYIPHFLFSVVVIALDYIFDWDYMLYRHAGGVPLMEGVADRLNAAGYPWLTTGLMLLIYLAIAAMFAMLYTWLQPKKPVLRFTPSH
ncbi:MAG: YwaF family protein [Clostridia bacterium]|nr:YwaF family protein [Clostridia bacterium]MBR7092180.1 YwaF family protein [Clostridia bacterium]